MKLLNLLFFVFLAGCATCKPPPIPPFPDAPKVLMEPCPNDLLLIKEGTTSLTEVTAVIIKNYGEYHKCSLRERAWIEWYTKQKENYDIIK